MTKFIRVWKIVYHALPPMWLFMTGRFFVFRNTPDWVVKELGSGHAVDDDELQNFLDLAEEEKRLRDRKQS